MLRLTLVRHASTALTATRRYQGWIDPPLSERGHAEALCLGERLCSSHFDRVLASDLRRCTETAALVLPDAPVEVDPRLREIDFGTWDGQSYGECVAQDGPRFQTWILDPSAEVPPEGEPFDTFCGRVDEVVDALPRQGSVLAIAHGGSIRRILARVLRLSWEQVVLMEVSACGLTRLTIHPEGGHLLCLNDTAHLDLTWKQ